MSRQSPRVPLTAKEGWLSDSWLAAFAEPLRLRVIEALGCAERRFDRLAQSELSFHLKLLKQAGLIADWQEGCRVYYRLQPKALEGLIAWLAMLASNCAMPASGFSSVASLFMSADLSKLWK